MNFLEGIFYMIWRGIAIGIIISAPMGPVGILCVQRTLEKGRKTGFFTGIGAAISDLFYCLITGFGLSFIEDFLERNQNIIQLFGSVVLIAFGVYLFRSNPTRKLKKPEENRISAKKNILNGFLFTVSNPLIIFLIIGLFARFNFMGPALPWYTYIVGYLSIGVGALLWWYVVSFFIDKVRSHFNLRSMWLINKIIGSIVLIFALVGIVSSVSALASASSRQPVYLNSHRGFGPLSREETSGPLVVHAPGPDTICRMLDIGGAPDLSLTFRARNRNNESGKRYGVILPDSSHAKIAHPAWGIMLKQTDGTLHSISLQTSDEHRDETYHSPYVTIRYTDPSDTVSNIIRSGLDLYSGINSYRLSVSGHRLSFIGGNHSHKPMLSDLPCTAVFDSIGFFVSPGAELILDWLELEYPPQPENLELTRFSDPDVLFTYLNRSKDPMEGIWGLFDRSFDEDAMRPGGDYRLAMVKAPDGYNLIYLEGARVKEKSWRPGMVKASLKESGFPGVYNVEWTDASGRSHSNEIKAEYSAPLLTINFPYQGSVIRLRKLSRVPQ